MKMYMMDNILLQMNNDNNITNMGKLADQVQRHGDGDTQEHPQKAGHGLCDGDCG